MNEQNFMENTQNDFLSLEDNDLLEGSTDGFSVGNDVALLSVGGTAYNGSISSTYLEYYRGIVAGLSPFSDYIVYRGSQYEYVLFYGENLEESGGVFTGSGSFVCVNTYNGTTVSMGDDYLSLSVGDAMVYSNIAGYSSLLEGGTHIETMAILFCLCFGIVYNVCHDIFDYVMRLRGR